MKCSLLFGSLHPKNGPASPETARGRPRLAGFQTILEEVLTPNLHWRMKNLQVIRPKRLTAMGIRDATQLDQETVAVGPYQPAKWPTFGVK
jgi:hypothetical protein